MSKTEPQAIVTRFAPSPTGYLHIGGARTALFNWLYARSRGGKFLLRIEDTDRARHSEAAVAAILDGLSWLGLDWDDAPVSQFSRQHRHVEIANQLLAAGSAYKCYLSPAETSEARDKAKASGKSFASPWRDADVKPAAKPAPGAPFTIRFKAPRDGRTIVEDAVQGSVSFPNSALDDLIIVRSNGEPTYNLAVVVDDHDMSVTHIIRGDDHLNNAARQQQIYDALGWTVPVFAHVPLIHGADGAKLSKRHGALGVEAYRDMGYLPAGLSNYLLRLGWSHGDDEFISQDKALQWFDINDINKAASRLDLDKLAHINAHYVAQLGDEDFLRLSQPFFAQAGISLDEPRLAMLSRAAPFLKSRCATLKDITGASAFLFLERPLQITGKAAKPLTKDGAPALLKAAYDVLGDVLGGDNLWASPAALEAAIKALAAAKEVGFGAIGAPVRAALTAGTPSPSLGEVLYALGQTEVLARLNVHL